MSDTDVIAPATEDTSLAVDAPSIPDFDPDAILNQAKANADSIRDQIEAQKRRKLAAETAIRDLNDKLAKVERIISSMTPRTRKPREDKPAAAKAEAKKAPAAPKKPATTGS